MKAALFTECGKNYGYGHLYRCLALADAFVRRGVETEFIVNGEVPVNVGSHPVMIKNWTEDRVFVEQKSDECDFIVIDSYRAEINIYETASRNAVCIFLDDFNRLVYPEGIVVNGAVSSEMMDYADNPLIKYLLGPKYAMLRSEFGNLDPKSIKDNIKNILVTFGGTDAAALGNEVVSKIRYILPDAVIHLICNGKEQFVQDNKTIIYHNRTAKNMVELMTLCDIAVSAAGQTLNELAVCGVPSLAFKIADNQSANLKGWREAGFIRGETTLATFDNDLNALRDTEERRFRSVSGQTVIDGRGGGRIVACALKIFAHKNLTFREVGNRDIQDLFELANDPVVRDNSFNTDKILFDDHKKWFDRVIDNDSHKLFIFEVAGVFAGQIRFDKRDSELVTSISIQHNFRGLGLGVIMLTYALDRIRNINFIDRSITAYIKEGNEASLSVFLNAGYKILSVENGIIKTGFNPYRDKNC
ncbi:MAG: bifunctional UDP-2,4-diacetamido-2,4,6-trideoxy-beta-L-altropyranose hydrolase/GNAT family N-acetyltransferase [Rikenellaceae bacterium]|nr:bifunctional UDP-2,4-diacetamido-2,4,6-trideoxy-beta-L-altropyranose hydrolase/GNAT family N-acetyltransferase [Rikenellaceae bacterium]